MNFANSTNRSSSYMRLQALDYLHKITAVLPVGAFVRLNCSRTNIYMSSRPKIGKSHKGKPDLALPRTWKKDREFYKAVQSEIAKLDRAETPERQPANKRQRTRLTKRQKKNKERRQLRNETNRQARETLAAQYRGKRMPGVKRPQEPLDPCWKCGTPVNFRATKREPKPGQSYAYLGYLVCPTCKTMYLCEHYKYDVTDDLARVIDNDCD